jgi:hypothetical protein
MRQTTDMSGSSKTDADDPSPHISLLRKRRAHLLLINGNPGLALKYYVTTYLVQIISNAFFQWIDHANNSSKIAS